MQKCMYIYPYVCIYVYIYGCMYAYKHTYIHTCIHTVSTYMPMHTHIYIYIYTCTSLSLSLSLSPSLCVYTLAAHVSVWRFGPWCKPRFFHKRMPYAFKAEGLIASETECLAS